MPMSSMEECSPPSVPLPRNKPIPQSTQCKNANNSWTTPPPTRHGPHLPCQQHGPCRPLRCILPIHTRCPQPCRRPHVYGRARRNPTQQRCCPKRLPNQKIGNVFGSRGRFWSPLHQHKNSSTNAQNSDTLNLPPRCKPIIQQPTASSTTKLPQKQPKPSTCASTGYNAAMLKDDSVSTGDQAAPTWQVTGQSTTQQAATEPSDQNF